nr:hypothetical protein [Paraburkholderia sp. NMBU_R16]
MLSDHDCAGMYRHDAQSAWKDIAHMYVEFAAITRGNDGAHGSAKALRGDNREAGAGCIISELTQRLLTLGQLRLRIQLLELRLQYDCVLLQLHESARRITGSFRWHDGHFGR